MNRYRPLVSVVICLLALAGWGVITPASATSADNSANFVGTYMTHAAVTGGQYDNHFLTLHADGTGTWDSGITPNKTTWSNVGRAIVIKLRQPTLVEELTGTRTKAGLNSLENLGTWKIKSLGIRGTWYAIKTG